jgi:predicted esterase
MQYAEENEFILICPVLADSEGGWLQSEGEEAISSILGAVAQEYKIKSRSFLVGFSAGAQFVIGYTLRYPSFVSAVSVISTGNVYQPTNFNASRVPFLITIGDQDPNRIDLARDFNIMLNRSGFNSTFYILEGVKHEISPSAINLTLQLFHQVNP